MADQSFFTQLDTFLTDGKLPDAAALLDDQELQRDDLAMDPAALAAWPDAVHMLCLMHADRLTDARFLYKRLHPAAAQGAEVQAAWDVLQCLWQHRYAEVRRLLCSVSLATPPPPPPSLSRAPPPPPVDLTTSDFRRCSCIGPCPKVWGRLQTQAWSPRCQAAVAALTEKLRSKVLLLLGKAYSVLKVPSAAAYLGVSEAEAAALAKMQGWELEADGMIRVTAASEAQAAQGGNHLQQLTDYVLHLEA